MIDPVSEELERRAELTLAWKPAVLGAVAIHLAAVGALFLSPRVGHRSMVLPRVQVRLTAAPVASLPRPATPPQAPARAVPPPSPAKAAPKKALPPPPRHAIPAKKPAKSAPAPAEPAPARPAAANPGPVADQNPAGPRSPAGGIAVGAGSTGADENFPYQYYLTRLLALVESNWFRPPDVQPSQCRVLCRIDRSGRLIEAGIEQPSQTPAFDRAALRAVYASSPFPPLPQGYGGTTLTLHLEFGP